MKVAFATQDLRRVDAHFGWAKNIAIYDVAPSGHVFLKAIEFEGDLEEDGSGDKLAPKIQAIKDCAILYVAAIGGAAAARVVASKIHPIKVSKPGKHSRVAGKARVGAEGHATSLAAQGPCKGPTAIV
ncbi:nitrogen fixation protein NifX [Bradyrhizobium ottawaense]